MAEETFDRDSIKQLIIERANARGINPALALKIAERESQFDPTARPIFTSGPRKGQTQSSAYGVFQITDDTWRDHGGTAENRFDVPANIDIGIDVIASNKQSFLKKYGREPNPGELYTMHFLGKSGSGRLFNADPKAPISSVVSGKVMRSNPDLRNKTVGDFIAAMQKKMAGVGDTLMAGRPVKEQGAGTVPQPQAPKETVREKFPRERIQPLAKEEIDQLGPDYKLALAAMSLADTQDEDEEYENPVAQQYREALEQQRSEELFTMPKRVAELDLTYQSPFVEEAPEQPVLMAGGGEAISGLYEEPPQPTFGQRMGAAASDLITKGLINVADAADFPGAFDKSRMSAAAKIYLDTFGTKENRGPITKDYFSPEELQAITQLIEAKGGTRGSITYKDYDQQNKIVPERRVKNSELVAGILPPRMSVSKALGQFNYEFDPKTNQYRIIDEYDFNPKELERIKALSNSDFIGDYVSDNPFDIYTMARIYGGRKMPPGAGRKIDLSVPSSKPVKRKDGSPEFGERAVPESAEEEYARFVEASKKSNRSPQLPQTLKEKILDPYTRRGLIQEEVYSDYMIPQPVTSSSPTTLFAGTPGAKVLELGGLQDTTTRGFIVGSPSKEGKKTEDIIFVAPPYTKRASDILLRQAPDRRVKNPNIPMERQVTLGHETEHLLARRGDRDINKTFDQLTRQAAEEKIFNGFFSKKKETWLRSKFVGDAIDSRKYLKDKFGVSLPAYFDPKHADKDNFHEQLATLSGIEQAFGVDLTQDPVLRKTLFEDPDVRRAYSAITGLRQTRLDPRDLPPYTLQPDLPYNPKAAEIRQTPVKRKGGSPEYGEIAIGEGGINPDTRAAFSLPQSLSASEALKLLRRVGAEGVSNLESLARGSVSAVPGMVGDIESLFRDDKNRRFATTPEVERQYLPKRLTAPTKEAEGFVEAGTFIDPTIAAKVAKPVAKGAVAAGKALAPTAAEMLGKFGPQPMYIVKPTGGTTYPAGMGSKIDDYLDRLTRAVTSDAPEGLSGKDTKKLIEFINTKGRDYYTKQFTSPKDKVKKAIAEGKVELFGEDLETFKDITSPREFEAAYDKASGMRGMMLLNPRRTESEAEAADRARKAIQGEIEKLQKEGVSPELINLKIDELARGELGRDYGSSDASRTLSKFLSGDKIPSEKHSSIMHAAMKGEPIYDLDTAHPRLEFMQPNSMIEALSSVVDDLDKLSFSDALIKGLDKTKYLRNEEAAIAQVRDGKQVPAALFQRGVDPIAVVGEGSLVRIKSPFAVKLEGAAMKHSVGDYAKKEEYGVGGKKAFLSGKTHVYSIRDANNMPLVTMDAAVENGVPVINQIKAVFNSQPTQQEKQLVFKAFDNLFEDVKNYDQLEKSIPTISAYVRGRDGRMLSINEATNVWWREEYLDYLRKQNAD